MAIPTNTLLEGDCLERFDELESEQVDLVFADPPFNIGYKYDIYEDQRAKRDYLDWCRAWMHQIRRVLKPNGTFWLAIGDEFAAELKLIAQDDVGFTCRSWVIWYYTFGVNCVRGFSRSHTHLFHFVVDPNRFTFNQENPAIRVPSARQLVYADSRANPKGRLPDNTWILRPQDSPPDGFAPTHDTWYYARVAGTFKEREGFHGCQMPEQLLGRIIRTSSRPRDIVLDPFSGSGTTLAVAKKLGRQWLGFELSREYAKRIRERLEQTTIGDALDGPADPVRSAPATANGKSRGQIRRGRLVPSINETQQRGIIAAFEATCSGRTVDYVLCQPELGAEFVRACKKNNLAGNAYIWNRLLMRIRKAGHLPKHAPSKNGQPTVREMDAYSFASEIAMHSLSLDYGLALDELLCDPSFAAEFDRIAATFAPGHTPFEYRWAALAIRKRARRSKVLAEEHQPQGPRSCEDHGMPLDQFEPPADASQGVYVLSQKGGQCVYVGETEDINRRVDLIHQAKEPWQQAGATTIAFFPTEQYRYGLQSFLIHQLEPLLNSTLLRADFTPQT